MNILALDPATKCGWAAENFGDITSGTWDCSVKRDESGGMRLIRFRAKMQEIIKACDIDMVVFEAARNAAPKMQGALVVQAEIQGVLKQYLESIDMPYRGYSPMEIKKHATGKGNANKQAVIDAAVLKGWKPKDDNEADALWLLDLAKEEYQ